jgi:hypothetical protein
MWAALCFTSGSRDPARVCPQGIRDDAVTAGAPQCIQKTTLNAPGLVREARIDPENPHSLWPHMWRRDRHSFPWRVAIAPQRPRARVNAQADVLASTTRHW